MDGFGLSDRVEGNAVKAAQTPVLDALWAKNPHTRLSASGRDVGLPDGTMGNSEVGHTNIGAGRIVYQSLLRISNAVEDGSFFENPVLRSAAEKCRGGRAHIFGLLSDIGVHSHDSHFWAMLELLKRSGAKEVFFHCFMDGRDSSPTSGRGYMQRCVEKCRESGIAGVATLCGRFYAMDRDSRWERVEQAYNAIVCGEGAEEADPVKAVEASYAAGKTDEFIEPVVCDKNGLVREGDTVFFMNFRPDRARELTRAFADPAFDGFERKRGYFPVSFICLTQYDASMPNVSVAYPPELPRNTLGEFLSRIGMTQLRIAETEKYAHVTFFFNGGSEVRLEGEDRALIPSPKVATYDLKPSMSAREVCAEALSRINSDKYDAIILNYANCDMVGHTGVFEAAVEAVETVDECVGKVVDAVLSKGGVALITADHGNADMMVDPETGGPFTAHTTNPVPFIIVGDGEHKMREGGRLSDIAPTMLRILGLDQPAEMTGECLFTE